MLPDASSDVQEAAIVTRTTTATATATAASDPSPSPLRSTWPTSAYGGASGDTTGVIHQVVAPPSRSSSSSNRALSDKAIIVRIVQHLYGQLIVQGREGRQAQLRSLSCLSKAWTEPVSERLWRGAHIRKLIFGEGCNVDIHSWPTLQTVSNIIKAAPNVQVIGTDGLDNVDLVTFRQALLSRKCLEELRACDLMPEPWCYIGYFIDDIASQCPNLKRLRLYNVFSENEEGDSVNQDSLYEDEMMQRSQRQSAAAAQHPGRRQPPRKMEQNLERLGMSHCAIDVSEFLSLLHASRSSLKELHIEYPMTLSDRDLLAILRHVGPGLRALSVHEFTLQLQKSDPPPMEDLVERILECCPKLEILDFAEAIGSPALLPLLARSSLRIWSFRCSAAVTAQHWLDTFEHQMMQRRGASCRVYVKGWTPSQIRKVRIEAYKVGINWLLDGATLTSLAEETAN